MGKETMVCTEEYHSAIKKNKIMLFVVRWTEVEVMLSEISQTHKKQIQHVLSHMWNLDPQIQNKKTLSREPKLSSI
jgi:hypothetical protein